MDDEQQTILQEYGQLVRFILIPVGAVAVVCVLGDAIQRIANDGWDEFADRGVTGFEFLLYVAVALGALAIVGIGLLFALMTLIARIGEWRYRRK